MVLLASLAVGFVVIIRSSWPTEHTVDIRLPDRDGGIRALHVEFAEGDELLRAFDRRFEAPTPGRVRLDVSLADGTYDVVVRTEARSGPILERAARVTLDGDAPSVIEAR